MATFTNNCVHDRVVSFPDAHGFRGLKMHVVEYKRDLGVLNDISISLRRSPSCSPPRKGRRQSIRRAV
jgi:hypothetical protein